LDVLRKIILAIGAILALWPSGATAQKLDIGPCIADFRKLCPRIEPGDDRLHSCMKEHVHEVSTPCLVTLAKFAEVDEFDKQCSAAIKQQCASLKGKDEQFAACLKSAVASLSDSCKGELARAVHGASSR
jgi:hypothetical protein